jgi:hypothetical protein
MVPKTAAHTVEAPQAEPPFGPVLSFGAGEVKWREGRLTMRVTRLRSDLSRYYDNKWVWLEGVELDRHTGVPLQCIEVLCRADAVARQWPRPAPPR